MRFWLKTAFLLLIGLLIALWAFMRYGPYQQTASHQIKRMLESRGLTVQSLEVEQLHTGSAIISHIILGKETPLTLAKLALEYHLPDLATGKLRSVEAKKLEAVLYQQEGAWRAGGMEPLLHPKGENIPSPEAGDFFTRSFVEKRLPSYISITESRLEVRHPAWFFSLPFDLQWNLTPHPALKVTARNLQWNAQPYQLVAPSLALQTALNDAGKSWEGTFALPAVSFTGFPFTLPPLALKGHFSLDVGTVQGQLSASDATHSIKVDAALSFPFARPSQAVLTVKNLFFPWGNGTLSVASLSLPLALDKPVPVALHLQNVELAALLGKVHGDIKSSGTVSGTLPFTYHPDGHITLQQGMAEAATEGVLSLPASLLPGDNPQITAVRTALEDFHYTTLHIATFSDKGRKSLIRLTLKGHNPKAFNGRPVNLNVTLTGDLLPFIEQSLLPLHKLKQWLHLQNTL